MGSNKAYISILGMCRYDDSLFDNLVLPEGVDKDNLVDNLIMETAELEVLYPDFAFLKSAIGRWSRKELPVWVKLYETTQLEYNPIWNKDGTIVEIETRDLTQGDSGTNSSNSEGSTNTQNSNDNTMQVAAYNSASFENREKNTGSNSSQVADCVDTSGAYTSSKTDSGTIHHERVETGNIGITTTQQMIREEREVDKFNIMDHIIDSFKKRFCLLIY